MIDEGHRATSLWGLSKFGCRFRKVVDVKVWDQFQKVVARCSQVRKNSRLETIFKFFGVLSCSMMLKFFFSERRIRTRDKSFLLKWNFFLNSCVMMKTQQKGHNFRKNIPFVSPPHPPNRSGLYSARLFYPTVLSIRRVREGSISCPYTSSIF